MTKKAIAVDLGGTTIKCGIVDADGKILHKLDSHTPVGEGEDAIIDKIAETAKNLIHNARVQKDELIGIGIGVPGFVPKDSGFVIKAVNLGWEDYPVRSKLEERMQLQVYVGNDANLAALGEMWKGAGDGSKNLIMVTLGTGVGGGIVIDGEVVGGVNGVGGEIGHITVNPEGVRCGCGRIGCLETESSATAMKRLVHEALEQGRQSTLSHVWKERGVVSPWHMAEAATEGDSLALEIFDRSAYYLAFALGGLINALNPEKIIIGGGVSGAGELLLKPLRHHLSRFALEDALHVLSIHQARLGNDAGMVGAAYLAFTAK